MLFIQMHFKSTIAKSGCIKNDQLHYHLPKSLLLHNCMFFKNSSTVTPVFNDHIKQDTFWLFRQVVAYCCVRFLHYFHSALSNYLVISMSPEWMVTQNRINCFFIEYACFYCSANGIGKSLPCQFILNATSVSSSCYPVSSSCNVSLFVILLLSILHAITV